jgi:uncharacterized protein (TIGR04255 family)
MEWYIEFLVNVKYSVNRESYRKAFSMGEKWKKPPVFYTVAQLQFNEVLAIKKFIPDIQELLRGRGYPDFQKESSLHFSYDADINEIQPTKKQRWVFSNQERTAGYLLQPNAVAFQASSYENFEQFSQEVIAGFQDVHSVLKLVYLERIGLRYLDAIIPEPGQSLEDLLAPGLLGFTRNNQKFKQSYTEAVFDTENGNLVSKLYVFNGGLPLPPDIHPFTLNLPARFTGHKGLNATLDNDCFTLKRLTLSDRFDSDLIMRELKGLKLNLKDIFQSSLSEFAVQEWQ